MQSNVVYNLSFIQEFKDMMNNLKSKKNLEPNSKEKETCEFSTKNFSITSNDNNYSDNDDNQ